MTLSALAAPQVAFHVTLRVCARQAQVQNKGSVNGAMATSAYQCLSDAPLPACAQRCAARCTRVPADGVEPACAPWPWVWEHQMCEHEGGTGQECWQEDHVVGKLQAAYPRRAVTGIIREQTAWMCAIPWKPTSAHRPPSADAQSPFPFFLRRQRCRSGPSLHAIHRCHPIQPCKAQLQRHVACSSH